MRASLRITLAVCGLLIAGCHPRAAQEANVRASAKPSPPQYPFDLKAPVPSRQHGRYLRWDVSRDEWFAVHWVELKAPLPAQQPDRDRVFDDLFLRDCHFQFLETDDGSFATHDYRPTNPRLAGVPAREFLVYAEDAGTGYETVRRAFVVGHRVYFIQGRYFTKTKPRDFDAIMDSFVPHSAE